MQQESEEDEEFHLSEVFTETDPTTWKVNPSKGETVQRFVTVKKPLVKNSILLANYYNV